MMSIWYILFGYRPRKLVERDLDFSDTCSHTPIDISIYQCGCKGKVEVSRYV
jgi:hypothetical protein